MQKSTDVESNKIKKNLWVFMIYYEFLKIQPK